MLVLKFGGTSIGTPQRMKEVAKIVDDQQQKIVVLSATSGTTNKLVSIAQSLYHEKDPSFAQAKIDGLQEDCLAFAGQLYEDQDIRQEAYRVVEAAISTIRSFDHQSFNMVKEKIILAQGEIISTQLFQLYCREQGISSVLISALDYMRIEAGYPDELYIKGKLTQLLKSVGDFPLYITQGYICRNEAGRIDNLRRGGSDYSAALIGAAIQADEIQIWTDIDGVHNNDPRYIKNTKSIEQLSFSEAAELAYFGAKILHPFSVIPAQKANIPVHLLNTLNPQAKGTIINSTESESESIVKAIAAKDGIIAIKIKSSRMLLAYGFLKKVFEIFEKYQTPIDMITTSEVAVSLTIDSDAYLEIITEELKQIATTVEVDKEQTIVCIVGRFRKADVGAIEVLTPLKDLPIRMISLGGSEYNISILVDTQYKQTVLERLHGHVYKS